MSEQEIDQIVERVVTLIEERRRKREDDKHRDKFLATIRRVYDWVSCGDFPEEEDYEMADALHELAEYVIDYVPLHDECGNLVREGRRVEQINALASKAK